MYLNTHEPHMLETSDPSSDHTLQQDVLALALVIGECLVHCLTWTNPTKAVTSQPPSLSGALQASTTHCPSLPLMWQLAVYWAIGLESRGCHL